MNERVNRRYISDRYGDGAGEGAEKKPKLTPDVVPGAPDTLRLTIMHAQAYRRGTLVALHFREYPQHMIFAARQDALAAADQLGEDDVSLWAGRLLTLHKVARNNPRTRGVTIKYVPAPKAREALEEYAPKPEGPRPAARRMRERRYDV